jgi:hypothetical protein
LEISLLGVRMLQHVFDHELAAQQPGGAVRDLPQPLIERQLLLALGPPGRLSASRDPILRIAAPRALRARRGDAVAPRALRRIPVARSAPLLLPPRERRGERRVAPGLARRLLGAARALGAPRLRASALAGLLLAGTARMTGAVLPRAVGCPLTA